jgi:hypothetical protein
VREDPLLCVDPTGLKEQVSKTTYTTHPAPSLFIHSPLLTDHSYYYSTGTMVNNAEYYSDAARDAPLNPLPSNSCIPPLEPGEDTHQLDLMRASRAYFCMDPYLERLRDRGVTKTAEFNAFQGSSVDRWKLLDGWINLEDGAKCYLFPKFTCEYVSAGVTEWAEAVVGRRARESRQSGSRRLAGNPADRYHSFRRLTRG